MNTHQTAAIESAIVILRNSGGHYSTRDIISELNGLLDNNNKKELRSTATMQQAIAIEVEVLESALGIHNEAMKAIGKARANKQRHVAGALATEAVCVLGDRLTRTRSLLSRLADGRK